MWNVAFRLPQRTIRQFAGHEQGSSAVEFAMIMPALVIACISMADLGRALYERMAIDHVLRSAAQTAMGNPGEEAVETVLKATAKRNFVVAGETSDTIATGVQPLTVGVDRYCACPEDRSTWVDCSTICPASVPNFVFYRMSGAKVFDGMVIPSINLNRAVDVQVR